MVINVKLYSKSYESKSSVRCVHTYKKKKKFTFRKIGGKLNLTMNNVESIVNASAHKSKLFGILCDNLGFVLSTLPFHTNVRWLSRGKVLKIVLELKDELHNISL